MQLELNPINGTAILRGLTANSIDAVTATELANAVNALQSQINAISVTPTVIVYTLTLEPLSTP